MPADRRSTRYHGGVDELKEEPLGPFGRTASAALYVDKGAALADRGAV